MSAVAMTVWTITLERISTGERALSMIVRRQTEAEARQYGEWAVRGNADLRVAEVAVMP